MSNGINQSVKTYHLKNKISGYLTKINIDDILKKEWQKTNKIKVFRWSGSIPVSPG